MFLCGGNVGKTEYYSKQKINCYLKTPKILGF